MPSHCRICNLCEACCGIIVETEGAGVSSVRGDPDDPLSQGHICPKAWALKDLHEDPDRLRRPLIKEGRDWREADWDEATAAAAEGLHRVQKRWGRDSVASFVGNPTVHNLGALLGGPAFIRTLGSKVRFSASSVDQFPRMLASYLVYGGQLAFPICDIDRSDYFLVLGANPVVSNGSLMTAPGIKQRLRRLRRRGGRLVVVDPRRTETACLADEHIFIRPGSDALLLAAMLHTVFEEGLVRLGAASGLVDGLEGLRENVAGFSPERVAAATGVAAATIARIARDFAAAPAAACYGRVGTCLQSFGTLANVLIDALNIVTGRLDRPGGLMFSRPAVDAASPGAYGRWQSRVRGLPEFGGEIPAAVMAEEMESDGEGRLRGLFTMAGNPVLSTPNGRRLEAAIEGLEFMVSVDPYLNETTCHADVILPPRSGLENFQYSVVFNRFAVRNVAKLAWPVFEPAPGALSEWQILGSLCAALARVRSRCGDAADRATVEDPSASYFASAPEDIVGAMLASGPYGLSKEDLAAAPSGLDLGPLQEQGLASSLVHPDGRIKLAHKETDREFGRLSSELESMDGDGGSIVLIGRRQLRSNNSWMHNCPSLIKGGERCTLLLNPEDARSLGIFAGGRVRVRSRVGEVEASAETSDEMMSGVASLPHGFGHWRRGTRMKLARESAGVSMNDLADEEPLEGLVGNAILNGIPVELTPL